MIKNLSLILILVVLATACQKNEKETPNGLKYTVHKSGNGVLPKKNEITVFDYVLKDNTDSIWSSTFEEGVPAASMTGDSSRLATEDGMTQMFRMLSEGDSISTSMKVTDFFSKLVGAPIPPTVDSTRTITYVIKVRDITSLEEYQKDRESQVFTRDTKSIDKYISENNLKSERDTSGLQYIIHNNSGGPKPSVDDCVEVKYTGRFLKNNRIFDQADRIAFPLNGVIAGWRLGIPFLGKGDSATLFIPSKLAYGMEGIPGAMPPDAILIFDVTLLDIKKEFDPQTRTCK